jgi:hypothetical protein
MNICILLSEVLLIIMFFIRIAIWIFLSQLQVQVTSKGICEEGGGDF